MLIAAAFRWLRWGRVPLRLRRRYRLVVDTRASPSVLARFAHDRNVLVRRAAARNHSTPPGALELLSHDRDYPVRSWVAQHPGTPPAVLARLLDDPKAAVARAAVLNPHLPRASLVRWQLAHNQAIPSGHS